MKEVDAQIWNSNVDDYNKILDVYPKITETTVSAINPGLEEIIKKASLIPEKHKNSVWLDDAYIIIGKSYLHKLEYKTSLSFFKFVNAKSKDPAARHQALIFLAKTYIDSADYASAKSAFDYLDKKVAEGEALTSINKKDYHLVKALYNQKLEVYEEMLPNLEEAVDLIKKKDLRARTHFIIGQLYQQNNNDTAAYQHYNAATKRNPPYELLFHAKLYMAQVSGHKDISDKQMAKYFKKLLNDKKNLEYRDKVYYEMGNYELKKGKTPEAIVNYSKSIKENTKNQPLKALTYLKLGNIYYDNSNFENAKLYYDSTVAFWDRKDKRFREIVNRQKILEEFSGYVQTVQREDSLQKLSKMSKEELNSFVDKVIADEKDRKIKEEQARQRAQLVAQENQSASGPASLDNQNSTFALSNPTAIATGITDFRKIWGNRKLEDNWRRSTKEASVTEEQPTADTLTIVQAPKISAEDSLKMEAANKELYFKDIPTTQAELDSSNKRIEFASFKIAQIYDQKLLEPKRSVESYGKLINRFPETEYKPESYYSLYLIFKKQGDEKSAEIYKNKLFTEFPNSLYTKLLKNPNYLQDNQIANMKAHDQYKLAFDLYKSGQYKATDSLIKSIKAEYPENDIDDKLALLSVLNFGQTGSPLVYNKMLTDFMETYTGSPLAIRAKELLDASENYIKEKSEKGEAVNSSDVKFSTDLNKPHLLVSVFPKTVSKAKISKEFKGFLAANSENQTLSMEIKDFSDSTYVLVIKGFTEKFPAQVFINKLKDEKSFFKKNGYNTQLAFIITNTNYQLFIDSKNLPLYLKFYKDNY